MNISQDGLDFIMAHEGCRLTAYADSVNVQTIGYGHIQGVCAGDSCTQEQAAEWLAHDVGTAEKCINASVKVALTQNQFDALCSFVFNLGCGSLRNSTLLRKLNDGDDSGAADEFLKWDHAGGKTVPGLTKRRAAERELCLRGM